VSRPRLILSRRRWYRGAVLIAALGIADAAAAHEQIGVSGGLASGLLHPITGLDHLIAMVAVGLWGAQLGAPAIWVLPVTFPLVMAFGGVLGVLGVPLPVPEIVIAVSALVLGAVVAVRVRLPLAAAAVVVGVFAIFHGHAHGTELPRAANPLAYGVGFVVATGLLHVSGIAIGALGRWPAGERSIRALGGAIAALGCYFLWLGVGGAR
jgi:urease accessory protein